MLASTRLKERDAEVHIHALKELPFRDKPQTSAAIIPALHGRPGGGELLRRS